MSIELYQRQINNLDKEIAALEKKKAMSDKKYADESNKVSKTVIKKNDSVSVINRKNREKERHQIAANKAASTSADLGKKIAEKRKKRIDANVKLQKLQLAEQNKRDKEANKLRESYENDIRNISKQLVPKNINTNGEECIVLLEEEYDVFVSHAWEDKETFVDEFVEELNKQGLKVWYDKSKMKWGDPMREAIDEGLKKSRFGVVVLSPNYIAKDKYWTKTELDGLFQKESINGKVLLPIWHNLTKKEVVDYSPIIANKMAMNTATLTPEEMAEELKLLIMENAE